MRSSSRNSTNGGPTGHEQGLEDLLTVEWAPPPSSHAPPSDKDDTYVLMTLKSVLGQHTFKFGGQPVEFLAAAQKTTEERTRSVAIWAQDLSQCLSSPISRRPTGTCSASSLGPNGHPQPLARSEEEPRAEGHWPRGGLGPRQSKPQIPPVHAAAPHLRPRVVPVPLHLIDIVNCVVCQLVDLDKHGFERRLRIDPQPLTLPHVSDACASAKRLKVGSRTRTNRT